VGVSGGHHDDRGRPGLDRDGVPLPTEPPGELAEVYPLHPPADKRGPGLPAAGRGGLVVEDLGAVLDRVEAAGPPGWLVEGLWPADAYGVLAAEDEAGKTWAILDLAVSVAAGAAPGWAPTRARSLAGCRCSWATATACWFCTASLQPCRLGWRDVQILAPDRAMR
jgi:hypothetical protein